jgi:hypothetical protein
MNRVVSDQAQVYRGLRSSHLTDGRPNFRAFLLRSAGEGRAAEEGLSVSEDRVKALTPLSGIGGVAGLNVGETRRLCDPVGMPLGLDVVGKEHPSDPSYAWIIGLPVPAPSDASGTSAASEAAMALCRIAVLSP